ncbi:MAG: VanW family protein, partial [Clostridia bacterium]|nr:VanW family protein [Clostridia bacterium]
MALACEKINGTKLEPGEEFSFNGVVGQRTTAN